MALTRRRFIQRAGAAGVAAAVRWLPPGDAAAADDPIAYSFVVMGCNRINERDITPDNPSTANLPQINRSFAEIARLQPTPSILFFTGDLVFGLDPDLAVLERQLRAWIALYQGSPVGPRSGIRLVALPGNHESLRLAPASYLEVPNAGAEAMWVSVMSPYIAGDNGPKAGGPDHLATDQSRLTYSFRLRDTHFVVMNTDPYGAVATVPWTWVANDVARARRDPTVRNIFCLGHKPAFTPANATPDFSLDIHPQQRNRLWNAMNGARVTALMTAHAHMYDRNQYASPDRPSVRGTWQVIAGNGGSQLDGRWVRGADNGYFGFAFVRVTTTGRVFVESHGRDYPPGQYLAPSPPEQFPTTIRDRGEITFELA